uniref:transporter substrate-binding domain-containing protein n=1 Tax=Plantactinospora solaniradicis TaxID=1723736 RepID=UPI003671C1C8
MVFLALGGVAACVEQNDPKRTVESLREKSPTLRDKVRLRVGVRETLPYLSFRDPNTGVRSGFEIEIAKALAADLGFSEERIDWVTVTNVQNRMHVLQANQADMVVASLTMLADRPVDFAGPYQLVPQAVMVNKQHTKRIDTVTDLRAPDIIVCTGIGSTSSQALEAKGIRLELVNDREQCIEGMKSGRYDAFSSDLPILASIVATNANRFEILSLIVADAEERIGVAVPKGDTALRDLIAYFLNRWLHGPQPSPWLLAYDRTIGPYLDARFRSQPLVDNPPQLVDYDSKVRPQ